MKKHSIKKSKKKSPKECTLMKTVIVVGAGASGIAAAGVLNKQGASASACIPSYVTIVSSLANYYSSIDGVMM